MLGPGVDYWHNWIRAYLSTNRKLQRLSTIIVCQTADPTEIQSEEVHLSCSSDAELDEVAGRLTSELDSEFGRFRTPEVQTFMEHDGAGYNSTFQLSCFRHPVGLITIGPRGFGIGKDLHEAASSWVTSGCADIVHLRGGKHFVFGSTWGVYLFTKLVAIEPYLAINGSDFSPDANCYQRITSLKVALESPDGTSNPREHVLADLPALLKLCDKRLRWKWGALGLRDFVVGFGHHWDAWMDGAAIS
jgi:hypothetical protein